MSDRVKIIPHVWWRAVIALVVALIVVIVLMTIHTRNLTNADPVASGTNLQITSGEYISSSGNLQTEPQEEYVASDANLQLN